MSATTTLGLPRPNPGPEPPPSPGPLAPWLTIGLAVVWITAAAWRAFRRSRSLKPTLTEPELASTEPTMTALAEAVRAAIVTRLGPSWAARTREELEAAPEIADAFGPETARELARFLREADRAKFAAAPDHGAAWLDWVAAFVAAGASSRIIGK